MGNGEKKNELGVLEIYCVVLLTLWRGTLDWIDLAMLKTNYENKLLNSVAISAWLPCVVLLNIIFFTIDFKFFWFLSKDINLFSQFSGYHYELDLLQKAVS